MTKASRLIRLITLLRAHRSMDCGRLARELGISERTVYRDILALSEIHVPIYYDGAGYHLQDNSFLPILNLDSEEYFLLCTLLEAPPSKATAEARKLTRTLLAKIEAVLPSGVKKEKGARLSSSKVMMNSSHDPRQVERWAPIISEAIRSSQVIEIDYDSLGRGAGVRKVEPYQILFRGRAFYLIAFNIEQREYRLYRLDRINAITITRQHFFARADYNPDRLFEGRWEFIDEGEWFDFEIIFSGRAAKIVSTGSRIDGEQLTPLADGRLHYSARVRGMGEIGRWVIGFGQEAEIIRPEQLRVQFHQIGVYLQTTYSPEKSPLPKIQIERDSGETPADPADFSTE